MHAHMYENSMLAYARKCIIYILQDVHGANAYCSRRVDSATLNHILSALEPAAYQFSQNITMRLAARPNSAGRYSGMVLRVCFGAPAQMSAMYCIFRGSRFEAKQDISGRVMSTGWFESVNRSLA